MKGMAAILFMLLAVLSMAACSSAGTGTDDMDRKISVNVGGSSFTASLEDSRAVDELLQMLEESPLTIMMRDYGSFEKVGSLGRHLAADDVRVTAHPGDIVLYQGNQVVIFYGSNTWNYTRLGHIDDVDNLRLALGSGDIEVTFSLQGY